MRIRLRGRHLALAVLGVALAGLAGAGCIGPATGGERITSFDVTATIRDDGTVAIREVIDWDFGREARRGIFRTIPSDGGTPTDIEVSAPAAPDQFTVRSLGPQTEVRIGDPDTKIRGRYRYQLTYVLPRTVVEDRFALDAIGTSFDVPIEAARVTVTGAELAEVQCFSGDAGSTGTCTLADGGDAYRTEAEDLAAGEGVTVAGTVVAPRAIDGPAPPPFVDRDGTSRVLWAGIVAGLAALVAGAVFVTCRQLGRNQVASGGATEAAFASQGGGSVFGAPSEVDRAPTRMIADQRMSELAGVEFAPPPGVEPWQAAVVLREEIDDRTIGSWFAALAAREILTMTPDGAGVILRSGPRAVEADPSTASALNQAFSGRREVVLGTYDPAFATTWHQVGTIIGLWTQTSGVFRRRPPGQQRASVMAMAVGVGSMLFFLVAVNDSLPLDLLRTATAAVGITAVGMGLAAWSAYRPLTRSLSVAGSAIALRSESFRRFLHDSEARHVEWAWDNGLLRQYSAWAVALGEAEAWNQALAGSTVPPPEVATTTGVMSPALATSAFHTARVAPSSSGSGGGFSGGGFSGGGSVGGGGGGGGGGSW